MIDIVWLVSPMGTHGGTFVHLTHWARNIDKRKYRVTLIFSCSTELDRKRMESLEKYGITLIFMPELSRLRHLYIPAIFKLAKIFRKKKVSLLHTVFIQADIIGSLAARIAKVPCVVSSLEGRLVPRHGSPWKTALYHLAYPIARSKINRVVAISHETGNESVRDFGVNPNKLVVIYNGVDPEKFFWQRYFEVSKRRLATQAPVLGYFGAMGHWKGVDSIIEAFPVILKRHPNARLLLVGEGNDMPFFRSRVQELGLRDTVKFSPWLEDISEIMPDFDIFILPSKSEGMPWAVLEAMASAKPVIASSVGGIPEAVIDGQTGILLPDSEPDSIAQAVFSLLESPEKTLEMALAARKRVEEKFTAAHEMKKIEELYDSLIKAGR